MTENISGHATYICNKCGAKHFLHPRDFYFEAQSGSERGMGQETQYVAEFQDPCHNCNSEINIQFEVWEYPVGAINYITENASGAEIDESNFEIQHQQEPEEPIYEAIRMVKPLLLFRFDQFAEQFVEAWINLYKKEPRATKIASAISGIIVSVALSFGIYTSINQQAQRRPHPQDFKEQYSLLHTTQQNLSDLEEFISNKQSEIVATQQLLGELEQKKAEIEPIVTANQEIVDALFAQQRKEIEKHIWTERGVSFGLGVLASLVATVIWHFVARFRKNRVVT